MKKRNYYETELGKVSDYIKNLVVKETVIDPNDGKEKKIINILAGKHDNDFIDKEKYPRNSYYLAYYKATAMINWAELSRMLAGDRSSITKERIPQKHVKKIDELRKSITKWILENDHSEQKNG